jgi:hypothetical protein
LHTTGLVERRARALEFLDAACDAEHEREVGSSGAARSTDPGRVDLKADGVLAEEAHSGLGVLQVCRELVARAEPIAHGRGNVASLSQSISHGQEAAAITGAEATAMDTEDGRIRALPLRGEDDIHLHGATDARILNISEDGDARWRLGNILRDEGKSEEDGESDYA